MLWLHAAVRAQLKADFTPEKQGGCSPLAINFTNATTGATSSATYTWDFGNGNSSSLNNPGAVFNEEKTYTVTLTVKDGNQTSSKTQTITVYKKPVVDFSASLQQGCIPLSITFTGNAKPGDGTVALYFWDFGDGITGQADSPVITHSYIAQQVPAISLTVTNSYGCQSTVLKQNIVKVMPALVSSFSADKNVLCTLADAAKFNNTSTGPGMLSYVWDFGDGTTSTVAQPSHVFSAKGTYPVKLTVTSSDGCIATSTQNTLLHVANFTSDAEVQAPICKDNGGLYLNKSNPIPDNSTWEFSDGYIYTTTGADSIYHNFSNTGIYTLKLTNTFGTCRDTIIKTIDVKAPPDLKGFIINPESLCGSPEKVNFKDTTAGAVKWEWSSFSTVAFQSVDQAPAYTFPYDDNYTIVLSVYNAAGCKSTITKQLLVQKPRVDVISSDVAGSGEILSCGPKAIHFSTNSSQPIATWLWDFGYGAGSTDSSPVHMYDKAGTYYVHLTYTTAGGCSGTASFPYYVTIRDMVKADFTASDTDICGNTPVTFTNLSGSTVYYDWNFGDGYFQANDGQYNNVIHQFDSAGYYTISLIATDGICADTMIKKNYIKISPPFPKITGYTNTCDGTRGEVTFTQASTQVLTGSWDFGDGSAPVPYVNTTQIKHTYTKTGWYKVVLSTTNGACTVKDSIFITVLLKQHPVLSADKAEVCSLQDYLSLTYSGMEVNPANDNGVGYGFGGWYYRDGTYAIGGTSGGDLSIIPTTIVVYNFTPGEHDLYSMVTSNHFGCVDTTNIIRLFVKGPIPGFEQLNPPCSNGTVAFLKDTSKIQNGVPLTSWKWNFGDGPEQTFTSGGTISHTYYYPQVYNVGLTVTDAAGCSSQYYAPIDVSNNSLKASFIASSTNISPGTTVNFTNTSISSDTAHTTYKWLPGDGTQATTFNAVKTYTVPGTYVVKLIAVNTVKGCTDTATATVIVKYVNAAFTFTSSYISDSKCPPVLVNFTSTSNNVSSIVWDLGDGTILNNVFNPSHVYTKPGFYKIKVTTYSDNGTAYTTNDSVIIKQPVVQVKSDILQSCTSASITLVATATDASAYLWDFGDGTLVKATDTIVVHYYKTPGIYIPQLVAKDSNGCEALVTLTDSIKIDSLDVSLKNVPGKICTPKIILFDPAIISIAAGAQNLIYHWNFGTGSATDTSNIQSPSFNFVNTGNYTVTLKVQSPLGCLKEAKVNIVALQGLGGQITGPNEICQQSTAQFTAFTLLPGQPNWKWIFDDGTVVLQQNPPARQYNISGNFPVTLIVDNNGCADTLVKILVVNPKPIITLSVNKSVLCEGKEVTLIAGGGNSYIWTPAYGLNSTTGASVIAAPLNNTTYQVAVTNSFGCRNTDSVMITVVHPFTMQVTPDAALCKGKSIVLTTSGGSSYQWINNTEGLSSTNIANPTATPDTSTTYTVTGTDANKCFTDTASIVVTVLPLPYADAGPGAEILAGTSFQLQATGSSDIVKWSWTPPKYLSCNDCAAPIATPTEPMFYTLTVTNVAGCIAHDTVSIKLLCSGNPIYIANAFTPNNDGINDGIGPLTNGCKVKDLLFQVYNRFGQKVFETTDLGKKWDGKTGGIEQPAGVYVYVCSFISNGTVQGNVKGSFVLIR